MRAAFTIIINKARQVSAAVLSKIILKYSFPFSYCRNYRSSVWCFGVGEFGNDKQCNQV